LIEDGKFALVGKAGHGAGAVDELAKAGTAALKAEGDLRIRKVGLLF
jgi:hypothetical protein